MLMTRYEQELNELSPCLEINLKDTLKCIYIMKTLAFCGDYDKTELLVKGIELSVILQAVFQENVWGKKC